MIAVMPFLASGVGCVNGAAAAAATSSSAVIQAKNTKGRRAEEQHMRQCLESEDRDAQHAARDQGACNFRQRRNDSRGGPAAGGTVPRVVLRWR